MINLDIDLQKFESYRDYRLTIVNRLLFIKISGQDGNWDKCVENHEYYEGVRPFVKISRDNGHFEPKIFNLAKPIVDISTKTFIGEEPDIVTSGKKAEKDKISNFRQKLVKRHFHKEIYCTGKNGAIYGGGILALFNKKGDTFPRYRALNPQFADVVYDCTLAKDPILGFNVVENIDLDSGLIATENYIVYVYTDKYVYSYKTLSRFPANSKKPQMAKNFIKPMWCFVRQNSKGEDEKIEYVKHGFSGIPIIEFPNNEEMSGDFDCVKQLISAYNDLQNNRFVNVDDVVNFVLMLKNVSVGDEKQAQLLVKMLKENRLLPVEGENVDAKFLTNQLDQRALQDLAHDIRQAIDEISRVPNLSGIDFSQNASDPIIKIKTKPLLDLCNEKELYFTEPYLKVLELTLEWCKQNDRNGYSEYDFDLDLVNIEYSHELPSNDLDMITQIANLSNAKVLNPESALQHVSWIKNVPNYIKGMEKYNESVDKRQEKLKNENTNNGINQTNIDRQNAKLVSKDQMDNEKNYANGLKDKINENE